MNRRGLLGTLLAAPVIIRTSGLVMQVRPLPVGYGTKAEGAALLRDYNDRVAIYRRHLQGFVGQPNTLSVQAQIAQRLAWLEERFA